MVSALIIAISVLCAIASGITRAVSNKIVFHFDESTFSEKNELFWNPLQSWRNKYKNGDKGQGAKFWGSTTIFVLFTDGWHLMEFLFRIFFMISYILTGYALSFGVWYPFLILGNYIAFAGSFHIFFTYIFEKKK